MATYEDNKSRETPLSVPIMMALFLGLMTGEFTVAVIPSLIASIVFGLASYLIPRRVAQRRIQP